MEWKLEEIGRDIKAEFRLVGIISKTKKIDRAEERGNDLWKEALVYARVDGIWRTRREASLSVLEAEGRRQVQ